MKIGLFSDWHIGITTEKNIKAKLKELKAEKPDLLINAGDNSGGVNGAKATKRILKLVREQFPDTPICWVNGNHDYWVRGKGRSLDRVGMFYVREYDRPSQFSFFKNTREIEALMKEHGVHFFDTDGLYRHPDFSDILFMGASGWYNSQEPPTNDKNYLPIGLEGDTNRYLLNSANKIVYAQMDKLSTESPYNHLFFISHFPVINAGDDHKGSFAQFSWSESLGEALHDMGCRYFLNGHAHSKHNGPLRYEAGSDYGCPKYLIIEV